MRTLPKPEEEAMRWPRTWRGWRVLFWLTLRCCPFHHKPLVRDGWWGDNGTTLYAFCCEGVALFPRGLLEALRWNARAEAKKEQEGA